MRLSPIALACLIIGTAPVQPQVPPPEAQIVLAVQAAPEARRGGAAVMGYDASGRMSTLFDAGTREIADPYPRYVLYTPWATVESTGLPDRPIGSGSPRLMFPGAAGTPIMISPPRPNSGGGG